ncbi:hypothetical protein [Leptospira alstonii]|uniref:Uncharacterized protein n=2 Tax=Leptospira alstonii TaxID=28452 RepID=M6CLN8_9LEPT|nr:hypothetical protein [Leptospira alstonii]EMJ92634.1 hypothetical protein LEP1GSC194_3418 [Leptospira alstonii serovar Sichuan str. 79601]EQA81273.1 hypothetical protein LEP1GSC193_3652 [Leptospira alstonii serovar Pingchang str. 80-412]
MTLTTRKLLLRINGIMLIFAAIAGLFSMDILGIFFAKGPAARLFEGQEYIGIGSLEAHGLALILGVLLFRAEPTRSWHITAVAIHTLLGTANILLWQIFIVVDSLPMGYITTIMHWCFVLIQLIAAFQSEPDTDGERKG